MSTNEIYNFLKVNDRILTGGQPNRIQLLSAADEGVQAVINLATYHPGHSLEDEAGIIRTLGMSYHHIPVDWEQPKEDDFIQFEKILKDLGEAKILIHCAANFRVTAFYSLYAQKNLGWARGRAFRFRETIWQGSSYPAWDEFILEMEEKI